MLAPRKTLWSTPGVGVEAACQLLRLGAADKVIDVGCGDGRFLLEAARRGARAVGLEIDAERAEAARANGCVDVRTCNALDEAEWSKAFDDGVTCAFLYLVPRGLRLVAPRLIERSKTRPIRVVTYMAPLPGATYVEKTTVTPAHQPSAAWPLYAYDLGVAAVKVCVVGRDAALVVGAIARYHMLKEDDEAPSVEEAVVRFPRTRYGVTNVSLHTSGEGPFDGYIVLASERWKDYVTAAHTSDAPLRLLADAGAFNADHARCAVQVDFEYVHGVDVARPKRGCSERDKDGLPRIVEALREADWASTTPVEAEEPAGPHVAVMGPDARPLYRALCLKLGAAPVDDVHTCTLSTKYYETPLTLSLSHAPETEALVYCGPPSSEAAALFANDLRTRLLVVQGYDTAAREWCAARGVELVSEAPAAAAARCRGALEATLWSTVAPPAGLPVPAAARVSRELSDHLVNAGTSDAPPPPPPGGSGVDAFEAAVDAARATCAEDLSDDARRERAADVATKLLGALGVGDESDSDSVT